MKKLRIGIFGKTLLFTCALIFAVSTLIVAVFSSQFLRYAEGNKALERENQKTQLITDLQANTLENAIEKLKEYQTKHPQSLFILLDQSGSSVIWKSDEFTVTSIAQPAETIHLISDKLNKTELDQVVKSLQNELSNASQDNSEIIKDFTANNPNITVLNAIGSEDQLNFNIQIDESGNYILEPTISGWTNALSGTYERSENELILQNGTYQLLIHQEIDNQETVKTLSEILIKVLLISFVPALIGSFLFAKWMTNPIRRLAKQTEKMAKREKVAYSKISRDEIGDLTNDVYSLYEQLNHTIQELENEMELVRRMESNQRNLFTAASHEMKTPIAAISALLEGMLEEVGDYKNHPKYLRECLRITDSMKKLVTELLEIVRLEEERSCIHTEEIKLCDLLSEKLLLYKAIAEGNQQIFDVKISNELTCIADQSRLSRAFDNIILNAIQNTKPKKSIRIWTEENEDYILFNVWNEAAYISPKEIPNLFEPFFRLDKARSRKEGHSGLGLAITKRLLDSMDMPFSLSNANGGVLFQIKLHK